MAHNDSWKATIAECFKQDDKLNEMMIYLVVEMKNSFPTIQDWDYNKSKIYECIANGLPPNEKEIWEQCKVFQGRNNQTDSQKDKMKKKNVYFNKIRRWANKLKAKMSYPKAETNLNGSDEAEDEEEDEPKAKKLKVFREQFDLLTTRKLTELLEQGVSLEQIELDINFRVINV